MIHVDPTSIADPSPVTVDPVFEVIEAHREAWAILGRATTDNDEQARKTAGLDISPETMALTQTAFDDASQDDFDAWAAVVEARPATREGIRAWLGYLDETREHYDAVSERHDYFGAVREVTQALVDGTAVVPFARTSRDIPTDWSDPPEGFMSFPALAPTHFVAVKIGIPKEAQRLLRIATAEWDRVYRHRQHDADLILRTRRALRLDELRAAAFGQEVIDAERGPPAEGEDAAMANAVGFVHDGANEVSYRDAIGNLHRKPIAEFIGSTLQRIYSIARKEGSRQFNVLCKDLDTEGCNALDERLRCDLRIDALHAIVFKTEQAGAHVDPLYPADRSDPVFAAYDAHQRAYGEFISHPEEGVTFDALSDAEGEAFRALLHTPLTTTAGKLAYALAVIEREGGVIGSGGAPGGRAAPLAIAYRNLRFGEHAPEAAPAAAAE